MLVGQFVLTIVAIFAGAAIYVSVSEQPARLLLDDRSLLTEWQPSYKHGAMMQAIVGVDRRCLGRHGMVAIR